MDRKETIVLACGLVMLTYRSRNDYSRACDCFCSRSAERDHRGWTFRSHPEVFDYIEKAIRNQLTADGFEVMEPPA
jgi:hypothetical protein